MNVLYASDDNYASILSVSVSSLIDQNINNTLDVYIIDDNISEKNKKVLSSLCRNPKHNIHFIKKDIKKELDRINLKQDRGSNSQFSRLFIQQILPIGCDRVLYLDCDTLILSDLSDLYLIDLEGKVIGGILDAFSKWHYKALGLAENDIYINSGVMLIDLRRWREEKIEEGFIKEILKHKGNLLQGDQGLINFVLKTKVKQLPVRYDLMCYNYDFSYNEMMLYRKPLKYYTEQEIKDAKNNPSIVHFTSSFASMRPWQRKDCEHPYAEIWRELYYQQKNEIQTIPIKGTMKIYRLLPRRVVLALLGVVHAYLKPSYWAFRYIKNV